MRIGLFTDAYLPDINGVVSSVATLKHALEELGNTVFIITNHKGTKIGEDEDGHILRLPGKGWTVRHTSAFFHFRPCRLKHQYS